MPAAKSPSPRKSVGRPKGTPKTGGRKTGVPNKLTRTVREMVEHALSEVGGAEYLVDMAKVEPKAFLTLVGKLLPLQISGDKTSPVTVVIKRVTDGDNG